MNNFTKRVAGVVAGFAALSAASVAMAQSVGVGGTIRLNDGPGSGPGGEFVATVLSGGSGSFNTFCIEYNEYFSYGQTLRVQNISLGAVGGGVNVGPGGTAPSGGNPGYDPISNQTAWLYTGFRNQWLPGYDFAGPASARQSDANALQNAIWYLENEIGSVSGQAATWVSMANYAVAHGFTNSNVRVLNLMRESVIGSGNFNTRAQDQLYIAPVPEPETYMMLLAGLGLMGFVARRRRRETVI